MRLLEVIDFEPQHVLRIELPKRLEWLKGTNTFYRLAWEHEARGPAYTAVYQGVVVACGGIRSLWAGVGEAWGLFSKYASAHRTELVRSVKEYLELTVRSLRLRRLQTSTDAEWAEARRFLEFLGFEQEAVLKRFGPNGADHILYAMFPEVKDT